MNEASTGMTSARPNRAAPAIRPAPEAETLAEPADLARVLIGVRAVLLDMDGVLVAKGQAIPGAAEALARLDHAAIPYRLVTNTSLTSRAKLVRQLADGGLPVPLERIVSALSATVAYAARTFPRGALYVLSSADAVREFEGTELRLLRHAEVDAGATAHAVVIGDSEDELTYANLNRAFRLIMGGARLLAMHKNRWWITPAGRTLDSGAIVAALEYATERRSRIIGKPSRAFFAEALATVATEATAAGAPRLHRHEVAIVGDDLWNDVLAGQRAGLRGVLVLSGKHGPAEVARAAGQHRGGGRPDAVASSIVEVVEALLSR